MKIQLLVVLIFLSSCSNLINKDTNRDPSSENPSTTNPESENYVDLKYKLQCEYNQAFVKETYKEKYKITCAANYHHYNADWYKPKNGRNLKSADQRYDKETAVNGKKIKISNFNIWHPGKSNTRFKDYSLVAKVMNEFDLVAGLELLPVISGDEKSNHNLAQVFIETHEEWDGLTQKNEVPTLGRWRNIINGRYKRTKRRGLRSEYKYKLKKLEDLIGNYSKAYKKAGYLILLDELRKLDPSWALLLSPWGEAAKSRDVHELVGYFYRARMVRPKVNKYCGEVLGKSKNENLFGCIPRLDKKIFSRRPFMASFESGNFDFTILASHVVFNSPSDKEHKKYILNKVFDVNSEKELGKGNNKQLYARFAEVKVTKEFLEELEEKYDEKNLIFAGDFNLEKTNPYFESSIFTNNGKRSDYVLLVDEKTSVSEKRIVQYKETRGYASNYDHFILNPQHTTQCDLESAKVFDFINSNLDTLNKTYNDYLIRKKSPVQDVIFGLKTRSSQIDRKISSKVKKLRKKLMLETIVKNNGDIVPKYPTEQEIQNELFEFKQRIFGYQLGNSAYYRVYKELVSDHAPVEITCNTNDKDMD